MKIKSLLSVLFVVMFAQLSWATGSAEDAALKASQKWLDLVDKGQYAESWDEAAQYFKAAVDKEQWKGRMNGFRAPFGKLLSRKVKSQQHATSLPGAPDGKYVVIQYETSFQNKKSALETVTPMLGKDGAWRVSGYYVR